MSFEIKQINSGLFRFYEVEPEVFYPSVTTYLEHGLPTPKPLTDWFKQNGPMSDVLAKKAAAEGTRVHNAIEALLQGAEINLEDYIGAEHVYEMILKYAFFHTKYIVEVLDVETRGFSHTLKSSGTWDQRAILNDGRTWLIDFKSSNYHHDKMELQTMAYKSMCLEMGNEVDARGVLHLKAKTRGPDKRKKNPSIQGKGWKLIEHTNDEFDLKMYKQAVDMFWGLYPDAKPSTKQYPTSINLGREYYEEDFQIQIEDNDSEE